jgi:hypothetical protein
MQHNLALDVDTIPFEVGEHDNVSGCIKHGLFCGIENESMQHLCGMENLFGFQTRKYFTSNLFAV